MSNSMLLRIFYRPIAFAIFALLIAAVEALFLPSATPNSLIGPVLSLARQLSEVSSGLLIAYATIDAGMRAWKLRQWEKGEGEFCVRCGGPVDVDWKRGRMRTRCWLCKRRHYL
jgi:hypothetical protein